MKKEEDVLKIITIASAFIVIVFVYSSLQLQDIDAKINAQNDLLAASALQNTPQGVEPPEKAKLSVVNIVDSSDKNYVQLQPLVEQIKKLDVEIVSEKTLEFSSDEAKQLIEKYKIEKIPTILLSGETKKVSVLTQSWGDLGTTEDDDTLVLRNVPPIFLDLASGKVRGLVKAVYVNVPDKNEVFPAILFRQILGNAFGMRPVEEQIVDYNSSEGIELIAQFKLIKIPTVVLSGDLNAYQNFETIWQQVGSSDANNNFVFRNLDVLQGSKYLDLNTNTVIEAAAKNAA